MRISCVITVVPGTCIGVIILARESSVRAACITSLKLGVRVHIEIERRGIVTCWDAILATWGDGQ